MSLWFDMTYSLVTWKFGVVGIIRAELEIAKELKKLKPDLKIVVWDGKQFVQQKDDELAWLWNSGNITDAYLKHFNRYKKREKAEQPEEIPQRLKNAYTYHKSRIVRLKKGINGIFDAFIFPFNWIFKILFWPFGLCLSILSKIYALYVDGKNRRHIDDEECISDVNMERVNHPFLESDIILSAGWFDSGKEIPFSMVKTATKGVKLVYLVYDLVAANRDTKALYSIEDSFTEYLEWISDNCDFVLYGGRTAKEDAEEYWRHKGLTIPKGKEIHFGSDVSYDNDNVPSIEEVLEKYKIENKYILSVGSIDAKKNQDVLYRAYTYLANRYDYNEYPELVIVGGKYSCFYLIDCIEIDPLVKDKITVIRPTDSELKVLYQNSLFTVLPSLYEGWSLTLPEAMNYGKFCIASNVRPLVEIGKGLCDFVDPYDMKEWGDTIKYYYDNPTVLHEKEKTILKEWKNRSWADCGLEIQKAISEWQASLDGDIAGEASKVYFDLTLAVLAAIHGGSVSGILRTQLTMARKLNRRLDSLHFFAFNQEDQYFDIYKTDIAALLDEKIELDEGFNKVRRRLRDRARVYDNKSSNEKFEKKDALALVLSALPWRIQIKLIKMRQGSYEQVANGEKEIKSNLKIKTPFKKDDLVVSVGCGFDLPIYDAMSREKEKKGFKYIQLIYDFTPIVVPQTHPKLRRDLYITFLEWTYKTADVIFYGGQTAMDDGICYAEKNGLPNKEGRVVRFGSDIVNRGIGNNVSKDEIVDKYGIQEPFILTVGTIEPRKNYETLYLAYLQWLKLKPDEEKPQIVIAGYPGWKTEEFVERFKRDDNIKGKMIMCTPDDAELEYLYNHCEYTILASLYEGWSLTLPQSLNHNKFCLASDVKPLREVGGDFIDYVMPLDTMQWMEKMEFYHKNRDVLKSKEEKIKKEWHSITWDECVDKFAEDLNIILKEG